MTKEKQNSAAGGASPSTAGLDGAEALRLLRGMGELLDLITTGHCLFVARPREDGSRDWWSGGTWLYPGDAVVIIDAADLKCADETIKALREKLEPSNALLSGAERPLELKLGKGD